MLAKSERERDENFNHLWGEIQPTLGIVRRPDSS